MSEVRTFSGSRDSFVMLVTAGVIVLLVVSMLLLFSVNAAASVLMVVLALSILAAAYVFAPKGYDIVSDAVLVRRLIGDVRIPFSEITQIETSDDQLGIALKMFPGGNSGLFAITGRFRKAPLGEYRMYATRSRPAVVLHTKGGVVIVTPDKLNSFVTELRSRLAARTR